MPLRDSLRRIHAAALRAADPRAAVAGALDARAGTLRIAGREAVPLAAVERIRVVGAGKAACAMARGAADALGGWIAGGTVVAADGAAFEVEGIDVWEAAHPLPDARGLAAAAEALRLARSARAGDLVLCLLSGGASALWTAPPDGVTLGDLRETTGALLRSGASIGAVNTVRRHLSRVAGGGLARAAFPARIATLAIRDVVGGGAEDVGSGPTVADPTTFADALEVLRRYQVDAPAPVVAHLQRGVLGEVAETAKPGEAALERASFHVVLSVADALAAAAREAERLGYRAEVVDAAFEGEAREVGARIGALARSRAGEGPRALLFGGEATVTVTGGGSGGRSQELAVALGIALDGAKSVAALAAGTDGTDGPTDAAGGFTDGGTVARGRGARLAAADALRRNDAYPFLRATGDLFVTGPTGTNVNDLVIVLIGEP